MMCNIIDLIEYTRIDKQSKAVDLTKIYKQIKSKQRKTQINRRPKQKIRAKKSKKMHDLTTIYNQIETLYLTKIVKIINNKCCVILLV